MKIVIVNQHTCNYGDDIAGSAMLGELVRRFPHARIEVFYNGNAPGPLPFNHPQVIYNDRLWLYPKGVYTAATVLSALIHCARGTGYFKVLADSLVDADFVLVSPCGANIGIYRDWCFLASVRFCIKRRKHVIFHLTTIGESNSKIYDFLARRILRRCHLFVREKRSHRYLKKFGISNELGVDSAFLAPRMNTCAARDRDRIITFIPTRFSNWHPDFRSFSEDSLNTIVVQDLCKVAGDLQLSIRLLPHLWGQLSEHKYIGSLAKMIRQHLAPHLDVSILSPRTAYDYDREIAASYLVVSMRYHGCILAIKHAVPFVALSYENKMKEACYYADAIDSFLDIKEYRSGQLISRIHHNVNAYDAVVSSLDARYAQLHRMAHKPIDYLEAFLTNKIGI